MGAPKTGKSARSSAERKAHVQAMRRAEKARERRNRILAITTSTLVVVSLAGWGAYALNSANEKEEQKTAEAKKPVQGTKSWDAKKLGRNHVDQDVDYPMTPAVGGDHKNAWMNCQGDVYEKPVAAGNAVHSLEHGAVWITYNDKASSADTEQLAKQVAKTPYTLMSPVKEQAGTIMLSAWGTQLSVDKASDPRVEKFLTKYVQGAQTPEPGAACTNGLSAA